MYAFLIIVHVLVCFVLIAVILLQAGRGGGLAEIAGSQPQSILGTQTNEFMKRATEVCAIIFVITSLSLAIISTHRGRSLLERRRLLDSLKKSASQSVQAVLPKADVKETVAGGVPLSSTTPAQPVETKAAASASAPEAAKPESKTPAGADVR